jgi:chemosensory pili system protein ChpA (sensor histidine kinase/response regulator)
MRVLVVEDDEIILEATARRLRRAGYDVATAQNGREVLEALRSAPRPRAVLLDLAMPVMDGRQFGWEQRHDPALADIPVIVVSATGRLAEEAAALGVTDYLHKPVDFARLQAMLRHYL